MWATDYSKTYSKSDLSGMISGNYTDATSYWKVPGTAGNSATITIPITYQPTSDITLSFHIATFGTGNDPSTSNTTITAVGTESSSNWTGSNVSKYPNSSTYVDGTMTITKPVSPTTLGGLTVTMGVNSGVKIFRLQSITVSYTYTASSDPSSAASFTNETPSLDLKDASSFTQTATTADGYSETAGASVTYSITANTADATIDSSTGEVTPTKAGSVTVQASAAAIAGKYTASSATYTLTVTDTREFTITCHTGNTSNNVNRYSGATLDLGNPAPKYGMSFVGWSSTNDTANPIWVANTTTVTEDMELWAMYEAVAGEYSYHLVEANQADWRGDYLIAYSSTIFADGRVGGKDDTGSIGKAGVSVDPGTKLSGNVVDVTWGDTYNVTFEAKDDDDLSKGYVMKTKDGKYNYQTNNSNGLSVTEYKATAATYPLSITYNSSSDIDIANSAGAQFQYNSAQDGFFRFYKDGGQSAVYLYKRTEDVAPVYSLGTSETVTIGSSKYASYCSSNSLDFSNAGTEVEAYAVSAYDVDNLTITYAKQTGVVPAGTGILLKGTEGAANIVVSNEAGSAPAVNKLVGFVTATEYTKTGETRYLGLSGGNWKEMNAGTIPANKAVLEITSEELTTLQGKLNAGAKFTIILDDEPSGETDGIRSVENGELRMENYD